MSAGSDVQLMERLNATHQKQIGDFIKFFKRNIDTLQREAARVFGDEKNNLTESLYSVDEVIAKLSAVEASVSGQIQTELDHYIMQAALYIVNLFLQAEARNVTVTLDTSQLDDANLLAALRSFQIGGPKKLAAIDNNAVDMGLVVRAKDAEAQAQAIQERMSKLQEQLIASAKAQTELKEQNAFLQNQLESARSAAAGTAVDSQAIRDAHAEVERLNKLREEDAKESQTKIENLETELKKAKKELDERIQSTAQFQQVQKLLQTKNELIKQLREQLKAQQANNP